MALSFSLKNFPEKKSLFAESQGGIVSRMVPRAKILFKTKIGQGTGYHLFIFLLIVTGIVIGGSEIGLRLINRQPGN